MSQTSTGARVVFRVNGAKVAYAQGISWNIDHTHEPINVLDQPEPKEHAETGFDASFTVNKFRVAEQSAIALGLKPRLSDLLIQPELTAELVDRVNGTTLHLFRRCKCVNETGSINAREVGNMTLNFVAVLADDEGSL